MIAIKVQDDWSLREAPERADLLLLRSKLCLRYSLLLLGERGERRRECDRDLEYDRLYNLPIRQEKNMRLIYL